MRFCSELPGHAASAGNTYAVTALEQDKDCLAILQQIAAVRGAVNGLMAEVMEGHIREHLVADGLSAEERQDEADKVATLLRSYLK